MLDMRFAVHKPIDIVYDYLTDMQKFASVHPVITSIDHVGDNSYLVHETLKFGFVPFSFSYPTTVEADLASRKVIMTVTIMKMIRVAMNYMLSADGDNSTTVRETIVFKSLLPTEVIVGGLFREQHENLFKNIDALN